MKKFIIVYAHCYTDTCNGWGEELKIIGIASNQTEANNIIKNFRKENQKYEYWMCYHTDKNSNIVCSSEVFSNEYLDGNK